MATIKTSGIVSEIRGKMGGGVFSRNKGGAYVRQFVKPVNPNSTAQAAVRALFGTLQSAWRDLTQEQKDAWEQATPYYKTKNKVGDTVIYSGSQLYSRINMLLIANGLPQIDEPLASPVELSNGNVDRITARTHPWMTSAEKLDEGYLDIDVPGGALAANERLEIFASPPVSGGIQSIRSVSLRRIGLLADGDFTYVGDVGTADILAMYQAVFGDPTVIAEQNVIFVEARIFNTTCGFAVPYGWARYGTEAVV